MALEHLKVYPATRQMYRLCADAEGMTIVQFMDALIRRYIVERNLQESVAGLVAHFEKAEAHRRAEDKKLRKQIREEILQELQEEQA